MKQAVIESSLYSNMLFNIFSWILDLDIQSKTKEAIWRIQQQTAEAEGVGNETLQELRRQGQQMVVI